MAAIKISLTHVCKWTAKGWIHTTADEVSREHPGGSIPGNSGLFMCDLCKQPVSYVHRYDGSNYFDHFKLESKNCPEHSDRKYAPAYKANEYNLPLRIINIAEGSFELELGLPPISREILEKYKFQKLKISSTESSDSIVYTFERLNVDSITYVSLGGYPCKEYVVDCPGELSWPHKVNGICEGGTLFDATTGRMLVDDSDVLVGRFYYLLVRKNVDNGYSDIKINCITTRSTCAQKWRLYKVAATSFTRTAANFFLKYRCKLTNSPIVLQPLWPVYVQSPCVIRNAGEITWIYTCGREEIVAGVYPSAPMLKYPSDEGEVYSIETNERQEVISTGYTSAIEYVYLWKDALNERTAPPKVTVLDINETPVQEGLHNDIPPNHIIWIHAPFDGMVRIERNGVAIDRISLKADAWTEFDAVHYGIRVSVLQGLDIIWSAEYRKETDEKANSGDAWVYQKLIRLHGRKIPVSHTLGATASLLLNYPKTRKWISEKIRSGYMEEDALAYYKNFIVTLKNKRRVE